VEFWGVAATAAAIPDLVVCDATSSAGTTCVTPTLAVTDYITGKYSCV
jgi:hypothetical protein